MVTNFNVTETITVQDVKEKYLEIQNTFELLQSEVICCARQTKVWLAISQAKGKFKKLRYESFFGSIQYSALKSSIVDGFKIAQEVNKYIRSVLGDILSPYQYKDLMKCSQLQTRINDLKKNYSAFR